MKYAYPKLSSFKRRASNAKYRAKKYNAKGSFTARTIQNLYCRQRGKCNICFEYLFGSFEVDHIKPLSKQGSNERENLQLLCVGCNRKKGVKYDES